MHHVLYEQTGLPIFQNRMYDSAAEAQACPRGDVRLVEDLQSGLIYNAAFDSKQMIYDAHYQNEQGVSPLFRRHMEDVADIVTRSMGLGDLVEIGCGKGAFIEMLSARGADVIGYDPAYEGDSPKVIKKYFEPGVDIEAKGLIMRHVLEHVQNPYAFLKLLSDANNGRGLIYIEVPCFDWICDHRAWFDVFYEHVNYFRLADFHRMFERVVESGRIFGGQYLYAVGDLATLRPSKFDGGDRPDFPADFTRSLTAQDERSDGAAAIWGGASKGVIFSLLKERLGYRIDTVIDINPAKQGRFLPATGICVQSPDDALPELAAGSSLYVMNSNYLNEIKTMSNNAYNYVVIDRE